MATMDEIAQEKQRIAERLARLDADRARLAEQLNELEITERVMSRFGGTEPIVRRRRGRPAKTAPPAAAAARRPRAGQSPQGLSLSDAALQAVQAHADGATAAEVLGYMARELGMAVRPNHLGIALQRHRRAGRLEQRDLRWFTPQQTGASSAMSA